MATHLESNASPESRRQQMEELLRSIRDIHNPVIVAGDLNTTGGDSSPTSIRKQIYQRLGSAEFWVNTGAKYATGVGLVYDVVRGALNTFKNEDDPTARNIPLVGPNPEAELFSVLEDFRFQTYRFAPHFARALASVNYALPTRLSDHNPISVDLPFESRPR